MQPELTDHNQTTFQKTLTLVTGLGGMSLSLSNIATIAQQIGMIVGCILVCGQAVVFFRGRFLKWKRGKGVE